MQPCELHAHNVNVGITGKLIKQYNVKKINFTLKVYQNYNKVKYSNCIKKILNPPPRFGMHNCYSIIKLLH